jgi:acyl-CoA reductase-like NAD-dependent aldehyde dehydrogenase
VVAEEQFGPALPILPYKNDAEAVRRANDSEYGLSGSVWSADEDKAVEMANALQAGQIFTNSHGGRLDVPFGGFKSSGIGRVFGEGDIHAFTETQTLQVKLPKPKL